MSDATITDNPDAGRFEAHIDGVLAGFAAYELTDDKVILTHTEVDPGFEGRGVGSQLAKFALDGVRADGTRTVVPRCPFMSSWIQRHPDYLDLLDVASPKAG